MSFTSIVILLVISSRLPRFFFEIVVISSHLPAQIFQMVVITSRLPAQIFQMVVITSRLPAQIFQMVVISSRLPAQIFQMVVISSRLPRFSFFGELWSYLTFRISVKPRHPHNHQSTENQPQKIHRLINNQSKPIDQPIKTNLKIKTNQPISPAQHIQATTRNTNPNSQHPIQPCLTTLKMIRGNFFAGSTNKRKMHPAHKATMMMMTMTT